MSEHMPFHVSLTVDVQATDNARESIFWGSGALLQAEENKRTLVIRKSTPLTCRMGGIVGCC